MPGYASHKTGQATEAILDRAQNCIIPNNGSDLPAFDEGTDNYLVMVKSANDKTVKPNDRGVTGTNVIMATTDFNNSSNTNYLIYASGPNAISKSARVSNNNAVIAGSYFTQNNKIIVGGTAQNSVKASSVDVGVVMKLFNTSQTFGADNQVPIYSTSGSGGFVTNFVGTHDSSQNAEVIIKSDRVIVNNPLIGIGTLNIGGSGTITGAYATALTNAINAKNSKLIGSILNFTYNSTEQTSQIITAHKSGSVYKLSAQFNTYESSGTQVRVLVITCDSGSYSYEINTIYDSNITFFTVDPEA